MAWHFEPSTFETKKPDEAQAPQAQGTGASFYGLGIAPKLLETLGKLSFTVPTPIQYKAIPPATEGKDMIGIAQTGTGKTLAFAIPSIQRLAQGKGRCLVLAPTRELAIQIDETFKKIAPVFGIKTAVLIGGAAMGLQIQALRKNPRVIIATPGRLVDHMERNTIMLGDVNILVLDEADRMLDMGFLPSIERIIKAIPRDRQTLLFSATLPPEIMKIATSYMKLPITIEVAPQGTTADKVTQELFIVRKESKRNLLEKILAQYQGSVLLFTRTKIGARKTTRLIRDMGHKAAEIHSDRTLGQRKEALEGFKDGRYRILVATDIAARGIDVAGIEVVINFDLPEESENYVHRIGRTARAGLEGRAISFATPDQKEEVKNIEKLIKSAIPVSEHPALPKETFVEEPRFRSSGHGRSRFSAHGGGRSSYGGGHKSYGASYGGKPGRSSAGGHGYNKGQSSSVSSRSGYGEKRPYRGPSSGSARSSSQGQPYGQSRVSSHGQPHSSSHGPSHGSSHGPARRPSYSPRISTYTAPGSAHTPSRGPSQRPSYGHSQNVKPVIHNQEKPKKVSAFARFIRSVKKPHTFKDEGE